MLLRLLLLLLGLRRECVGSSQLVVAAAGGVRDSVQHGGARIVGWRDLTITRPFAVLWCRRMLRGVVGCRK